MAATQDLLHGPEGDLDVTSGDLTRTATVAQLAAQNLDEYLQFWEGEWYQDIRLGMPMWTRILGQKYNQAVTQAVFRKAMGLCLGVANVDQLVTGFNGPTRELTVQARVRATDGTVLDVGPFIVGLQ